MKASEVCTIERILMSRIEYTLTGLGVAIQCSLGVQFRESAPDWAKFAGRWARYEALRGDEVTKSDLLFVAPDPKSVHITLAKINGIINAIGKM